MMKKSWFQAVYVFWVLQPALAAVEWKHGMRLTMASTRDNACPNLHSQVKANKAFLQVYSTSKNIVTGGAPPSGSGSSFYITNGFHTAGRWDSNSRTGFMNAEPLAAGGGCWSRSGTGVGVSPCDNSNSQTFYIEALDASGPTGPFDIKTHNLDNLQAEVSGGMKVLVEKSATKFCFYEAFSGASVSWTKAHRGIGSNTNLTGVALLGPDKPTSINTLVGCQDSMGIIREATMDCTIAKAVNNRPGYCATDPQADECILGLLVAFCGDIPSIKVGANSDREIEACMKRISQGPCVANPGGAACLSGQFAGIKSLGSGGGVAMKRQTKDCLLCSEKENQIPLLDQFWVGAMKNIINVGIGLVNMATDRAVEKLQNACHAVSMFRDLTNAKLSARIQKNCDNIFRLHNRIKPLDYDNDIEKAGSIFVDVLSIVDGVGTIVEAAGGITKVTSLLEKFAAKEATALAETPLVKTGYVLEAEGKTGKVRIYRDAGDGSPLPLTSDEERVAMKRSVDDAAFKNCKKCIARPVKRSHIRELLTPRQTTTLNLCCMPSNKFEERPEENYSSSDSDSDSDDDSFYENEADVIPVDTTPRTIGKLTTSAGLSVQESTLLRTMRTEFSTFFVDRTKIPLDADAITKAFFDARYTKKVDQSTIAMKAKELYGITEEERQSISDWTESNMLDDAFVPGVAQIPPTTGRCLRTTNLSPEALKMLREAGPGLRSKKTGGIYEIRDLLLIRKFMGGVMDEGDVKVMASFVGFQREYETSAPFRFVINSKTGRYVEPLMGFGQLAEVDFVQGWGEMKLLGSEVLNGGEAARLAGKRGPFEVFYFDEIDLGVAKPRICSGTTTANCRAKTLKPPVF